MLFHLLEELVLASLQNRAGKPRAFKPGRNGPPVTTTRSGGILPDFDHCACFEPSGAGRWPGTRCYTNTRKRNSLLPSALSSTPEFVGQKVWIHLARGSIAGW